MPRVLLDGLPKDPFSDEDFEYRVTGEGFVLRCRYEDIGAPLVRYDGGKRITSAHFREYEFKAR